MTFKELAQEILALPTLDLDKPAGVWPPGDCPASSFVPITGIDRMRTGPPVLSTGKSTEDSITR